MAGVQLQQVGPVISKNTWPKLLGLNRQEGVQRSCLVRPRGWKGLRSDLLGSVLDFVDGLLLLQTR